MNPPNAKDIMMVVDDEAPMRTLLTDFLLSQGYAVRSFSSALEALKFLRTGAHPKAIISDVRMSPMDGIDLLRVVRRDFPQIPVFLFTGAGGPDEKAQVLKLGAYDYLAKPFSLGRLKANLDKVLHPHAETPSLRVDS